MSAIDDVKGIVDSLREAVARAGTEYSAANSKIAELQSLVDSLTKKPKNPPPPPANSTTKSLSFYVKDATGGDRASWEYARAGLPVPEDWNVTDPKDLSVWDEKGASFPADIRVTGRWRSAKSPNGIKWVHITFRTNSVKGGAAERYKLVNSPSPGVYPVTLKIDTSSPNAFAVDTGAAVFKIGPLGLTASTGSVPLLQSDGLSCVFNGIQKVQTAGYLRNLYVEYAGPLVAYVVAESITGQNFGGPISVRRRYEFRAGEATVFCTERVLWEGTLNGGEPKAKDGSLNAVKGSLVREILTLPYVVSSAAVSVYDRALLPPTVLPADSEVALNQKLRPNRMIKSGDKFTSAFPPSYEITKGGNVVKAGTGADGGGLSIAAGTNKLTVMLKNMHRYEPQRLSYANGSIRLDLASDSFWLANHQGFFVNYSISLDTGKSLDALWRETNYPLRGLAAPEAYATVESEIPSGVLPANLSGFDTAIDQICNTTLTKRVAEGLQGLLTWGLYPRYWEEWGLGDGEMGSGVGGWDELYLNATWTDYWCTVKTGVEAAIRREDPGRIEDLVIPGAQRMLHTQILNGSPGDTWFYLGQAPMGYGMYRADFNSSHQYWENLYWYYWITGDYTVVETLLRGARAQVGFMRKSGSVSGRQPHQWILTFRFLASAAATDEFGTIFEEMVARSIKDCYLTGTLNGNTEAVWVNGKYNGPGTYETVSFFFAGFYDMESLYWYGVRTGNASVNGVTPFEIMAKLASTAVRLAPALAGGDGTAKKAWCRAFNVTHDGTSFTSIKQSTLDGELVLYDDDKPSMCSWLSRAASFSGLPELKKAASDFIQHALGRLVNRGVPMGKLMGLAEGRLAAAVAREAKG